MQKPKAIIVHGFVSALKIPHWKVLRRCTIIQDAISNSLLMARIKLWPKRMDYNNTSNKKHFMKNVKECRDVNRQKYQNKVGMLSSHITHTLDP